jgi:hypothetical protein
MYLASFAIFGIAVFFCLAVNSFFLFHSLTPIIHIALDYFLIWDSMYQCQQGKTSTITATVPYMESGF